ncbi:MAG: cysteine--tRNA ligase [Bacilli bacterium]|jgi:cysteinyl-tRNA synthetase|nr:cysteine--tRNA ligase [Bacilli bacterium]
MKLYNTLSGKIEPFVPLEEGKVKMYTCGPTVYHYAHIGNLRNYIMEDILEKTLRYIGYEVTRVMNITDVGHLSSDADTGEDKMLKGAKREHKTVLEIADLYTKAFFQDCEKLNIKYPDIVSPATSHIADYIKMIETLLAKGYAYESQGNIYFDTSKLDDYYQLTNHQEDDLVVGARAGVEYDDSKRNQADFVLWFTKSKFDDQELKWDSPWGIGYPGWHIECSCISMCHLGETLDIHCGGVDNIFPHHTNEIAQSEAYLGHKWCNYWVHNEHLNIASGKMSKSTGEFITVATLEEKGFDPLSYRFFCLGSHYRKQLLFHYESLESAAKAYQKLKQRVRGLLLDSSGEVDSKIVFQYDRQFQEALMDDLNTANACTVLYDVLKLDCNNATKLDLIRKFDSVLSLSLLETVEVDKNLEQYILEQIAKRQEAKEQKDFATADRIRSELLKQGIVLRDTRVGTTYEIEEK